MLHLRQTVLFALILLCAACSSPSEPVAKVFFNGKIWTEQGCRDSASNQDYCANYLLVDGEGKIMEVGTSQGTTAKEFADGYGTDEHTSYIDLNGAFVTPGLIEGHAHFSGLGSSLRNLYFLKSKSWNEIVGMVAERANELPAGAWVTGRGWHQEKWDEPHDHSVGGYPIHDELSKLTAEHPVVLRHASGHALFANKVAMDLANVSKETPDPEGGRILRDVQGNPTGVFEERAMDLITDAYQDFIQKMKPEERKSEWLAGIRAAEQECLRKGITSFQDAGSTFQEIEWYKELADNDSLDLRLWAMLRHPYREMAGKVDDFPVSGGQDVFYCGAIKTELDGALGSYGAWLLEEYFDNPGFTGQNTTSVATVDSIAQLCLQHDLQLCVHAIGDRANRETLDVMEKYIGQSDNTQDLRWRIEHSQHLHPEDIPRFGQLGVIASMQGIHCTSDALFAEKRLGTERARTGAYPWRSLLDAGAVVTNGTDAPVEDVDPIESFYASVTRRRVDRPDVVFFPEQSMSREEALHSYTAAPAYAAFEEDIKGRLVPGTYCDLTVMSNNLLTCADEEIMDTDIIMTVVGGIVMYESNK
ncbi:amidohydrolase [Lewinellaceae bacterium SD302]|nr:amidohydrolase [Lewinellaceae bacterium SD302]